MHSVTGFPQKEEAINAPQKAELKLNPAGKEYPEEPAIVSFVDSCFYRTIFFTLATESWLLPKASS